MKFHLSPPSLTIRDTGTPKGRGVFATRDIRSGDVVEVAPVLVLKTGFESLPDLLKTYVFNWTALTGVPRGQAVALGYGSMYNHGNPANLRYIADARRNVMRYVAARDIAAGEELTINYNASGGAPESDEDTWFENVGIDVIDGAENGAVPASAGFRCVPGHEPALDWVRAIAPVSSIDLVSNNSWSTTYRLRANDSHAYLKILPPIQHAVVRRTTLLSGRFSPQIPAVIAARSDAGWIVSADHGGRPPSTDDSGDEVLAIVGSYAAIQLEAAADSRFLAEFPPIDIDAITDELLAFLSAAGAPAGNGEGPVGIAHFVGEHEARRYQRLFAARAQLLRDHLARAKALAPTLCHGDLHPWNTAILPDDRVVIFDWDEVAIGPAGMCLHGLLDGVARATHLIQRLADGQPLPNDDIASLRLGVYLDALSAGRYAAGDRLLESLPAAMCAGLMRFVISYGRYPGEEHRESSGDTLRSKLSDLLDVCDWLASRESGLAIECVDDYVRGGDARRAWGLCREAASRFPHDMGLVHRCGVLALDQGCPEIAETALATVVAARPGDIEARLGLARALLCRLACDDCEDSLAQVLERDPRRQDALALRARAAGMKAAIRAGESPDGLPRWALSDGERDSGNLGSDTLALAVDQFRRHGVVQLDNVFPAETISRLRAIFLDRYGGHFYDGEHSDALRVGDKRFMLTMSLDDVFGDPRLVASGLLMPIMERLLGSECILGAYTAVISLPGSTDQQMHKDHSALFEEDGWRHAHAPFAAQAIIPLLELNPITGATRMVKGSQRASIRACADLPAQDPVVPLGSCVLVDYSIAHLGKGNRSDHVRPILNLVYSRPWFRDCRNYHLQPPLRFDSDYFQAAPNRVRSLIGWWDLERRIATA